MDEQIVSIGRMIDANNQLISVLDEQAIRRSNLSRLSGEEAALASKYTSAQITAQQHAATAAAAREQAERSGTAQIQKTQQALSQLTQAYKGIQTASRNSDETSKAYWTQKASAAMAEIQAIDQSAGK